MVFSSITFLFYFLPILVLLYFIAPTKLKNLVMILGSFVFYAWGEIRFIPVMLALSVEDYVCGRFMEKYRERKKLRRLFMLVSVCSNLGVLIYFKYTVFFAESFCTVFMLDDPALNIILPIGVSFNTFQSISYAIDVYRGTTSCEKSYYNYLAYTTLFPQIIAGPIVRYVTVENDLDERKITLDGFSVGMKRFIVGLAKKVLIANSVGFLWSSISAETVGGMSVLTYWMGAAAYTFQIYFDFSGYSDMAIGLARVFGFTFDENFNFPYISKSITEFWRRWHITLGAWFRDYVYIPLGGNRCRIPRHLFNLAVVWALTGFWHGASWNFVLWGLYFAAILIVEKYFIADVLARVPAFVGHLYTMLLVTISWIIFYFEDVSAIGSYLGGMFGLNSVPAVNGQGVYYLLSYGLIFLGAGYFCTPHCKELVRRFSGEGAVFSVSTAVGYTALFLLCVAYLVNSTYNPFLYFRF